MHDKDAAVRRALRVFGFVHRSGEHYCLGEEELLQWITTDLSEQDL